MRDHLGIGLAGEDITAALQAGAQLLVVLDDAVVRERDTRRILARREVRMGIVGDRLAVGCPARVGDAGVPLQALPGDVRLQGGDPVHAARAHQLAIRMQRDTARVVSAVLQPLQALDKIRDDIPLRDGANDSAHIASLS